jgi:uncharacterized protein YifE (UPF0438 family)
MRRLANEPNTSSLWKRFVDSVRAAFRRLFNGRLTERDLKMAADRVAARSFRAMAAQSNRTGTRFSYIGEQSIKNLSGERRKFMADSLDAAKAMAAAGKSREEIRAVTGWFPGKYDGKMRWEIPDGGAYLKRNWEDSGVFSNLIEHPALLEAYPDLKYVGVSHRELPDGIYAQYSPDYDLITLNSNVTNRKEVLSYVLHELQHAVQKRESFARGSSMDEAYLRIDKPSVTRKEVFETYQKAAGEIEARDVQARQNLTPEQRKATAPYSSENIAEEDAIVMFESGGPQASMSMPSPEAQRVDQEYMAAVEAGDMETAQRLVDEAAQKAGYDIKGYHGTRSPVGFTEFIPNEALGRAIFVAVDPSEAQAFGRIMPVFIKTQNVRKGVVRSYAEVSAIAAAKKRGQDAIRVTDGIGAPINYAVFDPNQIKSANAVERDDAENIIPPSQRFNAASSDIRYSLPDPNEPAPAVPDVGPNALTRETVAAESVLDRLNKFILGYERESNEPKTAAKKAAAKKVAKKAAAPKPKPKKEEVDPNVSAVNQFIAEFKKNSGVEKADAEPKAKNPAKETLQRYTKLPTKKEGPGYPLDEDGETAFMSDLTQELVDLGVPVALAAEASAYAWARYSTKKQNQIDKKALAEFEKAQAEKERQAEKQEAQKNRPTQIAQAFIDRVDESQTEFVVEPGAKTLDLVSQALRDASKAPRIGPVFDTSPEAKRTFINALSSKLSSLGVDRVTAETAANRAWLKYQASRSAKEIDARDKETLAAAKKEIRARELQNKKEEREIQAAIDKPNNSAQSFIDAVDESQTETMPAERTVDPVRKALQEASSVPKIGAAFDLSPEAKSVFIAGLKSKLMSLGVDETLARTASERAWSKYQASRTAKQKTVRENEATAKAEALQKAREKPNNTAKAYIKNATTSITTTEEKVKNPVTQALNEAAKISRQGPAFDSSPQAKNAFMTGLSSKLMSLGVDSQTAWSASNVAWDKYQTALEAKAASLLKEFEKNIPATLARKIKELPVFRQNDAEYVRQYIKDLFIFAGLTSEVAEAATTLYSAKYAQMLKDARVKAATKYIENEASPKTKDVLKKRPNELDKILEAIRLGVTDPSMTVALALSDQSKFQRFTQEEHNRMVALEEEINDEDTPNLIKLERTQELVKLAESKMNDFNAIKAFTGYLVGNTLSGIGTAAIQIWTPAYSMGNRLATDGMRGLITGDPKRFIASLTALMNSADSVNAEFKYAFGNDVYRRGQQAELQTLSELRKVLDKNIPIFQNPKSGVEKAVAAAKIALAAPDYVRRLYSSMDTASQSLFINQIRQVGLYDLLRKNGMDMKKFEIMLEAKRLYRDSIITTLTLEGKYTPTQIRLIAEDSAIEDFGVRVAEAIGADGAQQVADLFRTSVNEGKSEIGVSDQVDGHAIPAILKILEGIKSAVDSVAGEKGQGAGDLAFRLIVGYPTTALKVLNRSLYFFPPTAALRYLTNRYYEKQPDFDPKADRVYPLLETHSQKLQRISEGIMGMFASAILLALLIDEKDKEEKDRRFAVHNLGPSDRAAKQAWRAAGNVPQSIQWRASENAPWISVSWAKAGLEALAPVLAVAGTYYDVSDESSEDTESSEKIIKAVGGVMGVFNRPLSGINDIGEILSGEKNSVSQKSLASYTAFRASGLVPFSSLLKTVNRMEGPRDMSTPTSTMLSQIPIAGPMLTEPAINMFGDPLGATPNELSYKLPIFPVQVGIRRQDVPFYEKILSKGQYPPLKLRTNFEKTYGPVSDLVWRQYVEKRGQMVKKLIIDRWTDLDKLSPEAYDKVLGKFANAADDVAIQELNIRRLPK